MNANLAPLSAVLPGTQGDAADDPVRDEKWEQNQGLDEGC
jgi:hypothetical protein